MSKRAARDDAINRFRKMLIGAGRHQRKAKEKNTQNRENAAICVVGTNTVRPYIWFYVGGRTLFVPTLYCTLPRIYSLFVLFTHVTVRPYMIYNEDIT